MDFEDFCIICYEKIKSSDAIWHCSTCYSEYHINCINDWIEQTKSSKELLIAEEKSNMNYSEGHEKALIQLNKLIEDAKLWSCPKCRCDISLGERPSQYHCYCGKAVNPERNSWNADHTCGQKCEKFLKPYCGDICLEICHRGPCPPCARMLSEAFCFCKRQIKKSIRCSKSRWSCNEFCGKLLDCTLHSCSKKCHPDQCGSCEELVNSPCLCGAKSKQIICQQTWKCSKTCQQKSVALINKCPCGKTSLDDLPKTMSFGDYKFSHNGTCSNICNKLLECGLHNCKSICHLGSCVPCRQEIIKVCKCGQTTATLMCSKEVPCQRKCERLRNCGRHRCKRKCCDKTGECQPCELICNNQINCKKHRCQLPCHRGPCYPCQKYTKVTCACGDNKMKVACGVNIDVIQNSLTIKCTSNCKLPSKCQHPNVHKCHSSSHECPRCQEKCYKPLLCGHKCQNQCHEAVRRVIRLDKSKLAGPWEAQDDGKIVFDNKPCAECRETLSIICLGAHESIYYECWRQLKSISCGRKCSRKLSCGNHYCTNECHSVEEAIVIPTNVVTNIDQKPAISPYCTEPCTQPCQRPRSCPHPCSSPACHKDPCAPCTRYKRHMCHCGSLAIHLPCNLGDNPPSTMLGCPARCTRTLPACGHQCPRNCHRGDCQLNDNDDNNTPVVCKTKVTVKCKCQRNKITLQCYKLTSYREPFVVKCDPIKCSKQIKSKTEKSGTENMENLQNNHLQMKIITIISLFIAIIGVGLYYLFYLVILLFL